MTGDIAQGSTAGHQKPPARTGSVLVRVGVLVAILVAAALAGYRMGWFDLAHTLHHIEKLRQSENLAVFVLGFVAVYALGTSVGLPGMPFNVAAGALFGTMVGAGIAWVSSVLGAALGYWIARTIGHREVLRWIKRYKRADGAIAEARNFSGMLRLRLIPVMPIGIVNFIGGLSRAPFPGYVAATAIGVLPSAAIYSYFADSLVEGVGSGHRTAFISLGIASVLLIAVSLVPKLFKTTNPSRTA